MSKIAYNTALIEARNADTILKAAQRMSPRMTPAQHRIIMAAAKSHFEKAMEILAQCPQEAA